MRSLISGKVGIAVATVVATLGTTTTAANAQVQTARTGATGASCSQFYYISGDAVRVRATPGGRILGLSWYYTRVRVLGPKVGQWEQIAFQHPQPKLPLVAWVSREFVTWQANPASPCPR